MPVVCCYWQENENSAPCSFIAQRSQSVIFCTEDYANSRFYGAKYCTLWGYLELSNAKSRATFPTTFAKKGNPYKNQLLHLVNFSQLFFYFVSPWDFSCNFLEIFGTSFISKHIKSSIILQPLYMSVSLSLLHAAFGKKFIMVISCKKKTFTQHDLVSV